MSRQREDDLIMAVLDFLIVERIQNMPTFRCPEIYYDRVHLAAEKLHAALQLELIKSDEKNL